MFENVIEDIRRLSPTEKFSWRPFFSGIFSQGFQALLVYRFFHWLQVKGIPGQPFRFVFERFIEITTGISIPAGAKIGKGLRILHFGGIIFHPTVEIGDFCTIYQGVTIGDRGAKGGRGAKIGSNVLIGAGAKILGEITIGDNCTIGANAVITKDMAAESIAKVAPCTYYYPEG